MALFTSLHDVAQVLAEHIREEVGLTDVQPGNPRDVAASAEGAARITLLYTTPQPGHRNDPLERQPDGALRPAPVSLSCFYLVTASGADGDDPIAAHHTLGRIITLYHDHTELALPLSDNPGVDPDAFTELGLGGLAICQVPMTLDQIDKIWTSLEQQLQPWALFEVGPVQLVSQTDDAGPPPLVRPGGLALDVRSGLRPAIARITPEAAPQGGRVRIDAVFRGAADALLIDGIEIPVTDPSVEADADGSPFLLTLDDSGLEDLGEGVHRVALRAGGMVSKSATLRIAAEAAPALAAPPDLEHDPANDLVLSGQELGDAQEAVLWPDGGLTTPADVHTVPVADVSDDELTVPSAGGLADLPAGRGPWRLTIRVGANVYTPPVVVELVA